MPNTLGIEVTDGPIVRRPQSVHSRDQQIRLHHELTSGSLRFFDVPSSQDKSDGHRGERSTGFIYSTAGLALSAWDICDLSSFIQEREKYMKQDDPNGRTCGGVSANRTATEASAKHVWGDLVTEELVQALSDVILTPEEIESGGTLKGPKWVMDQSDLSKEQSAALPEDATSGGQRSSIRRKRR